MSEEEKPPENHQPNDEERLLKLVDDRIDKTLTRYGKQIIDKLDNFSIAQSQKIDAKLDATGKAIIDIMGSKFEGYAQTNFDKNIERLTKEAQARQAAQPSQPPVATPEQPHDGSNPPMPTPTRPIDYFWIGAGKFLGQVTPQNVVDVWKSWKGAAAPVIQPGDYIVGLAKFNRLVGELSDVRNLDDAKLEKIRKDGNEIFKASLTPSKPSA